MLAELPPPGPEVHQRLNAIARHCFADRSRWRKRLWRLERNATDIEDILQEALLQAHLSIHSYRGEASLEAWFMAVLMNVARQHVAREVRRTSVITGVEAPPDGTLEHLDDLSPSEGHCPFHRAWLSRVMNDLEIAIAKLPTELRRTFELTCVEELSYHDAAEQLGVPIGTVRSRVNRARTALRGLVPLE